MDLQNSQLRTNDDLRSVYRPASGGAVDKVINVLDPHCVDFLARSPLFVLSTADADGNCDGSPKGGEPGFVQPLDSHRLAWADYSGNNRLDSFENVLVNNRVALLFMIPGFNETLRVNGTAQLSTDPELCQQFVAGGKPAGVVAVVTVGEAYIHCSKAFHRSSLWSPDSWQDLSDMPSGACMVRDHAALDLDDDTMNAWYDGDIQSTMWEPGGAASTTDS